MTEKQSCAFSLLTNDKDVSVLFGGAKGGGKDFLFCVWVRVWVEKLIQFFGLQPSKDPVALGWIGRKRSVDFKDTTLEEWKRLIPSGCYRLHDNESEIILWETAKVFCGGLDDPKRVEKFNSANYAFFALNQAEETERNEVGVLRAALRMKLNGKQPPYKELYTANPADCWLKTDFIDSKLPNHYFVPSLYTDNPHLPANYRTTLELAFRHNEALLKAYRDGDWMSLQSMNTLITDLMLQNLRGITIYPQDIRRIVSCDPSLGGDECVIDVIENGRTIDQEILHERDTMKIAGKIVVMGNKWRCPNFAVDTIGIGQGISDRIREVKPNAKVYGLNSAEKAADEVRFANKRAEMYWYVMELIQDRKIPFPEDEELRRQLVSIRFKVINSNGKILLEPKEETKKRLNRSPDRSDAWVQGLYCLRDTMPLVFKDAWAEESRRVEVSSGATSAMVA